MVKKLKTKPDFSCGGLVWDKAARKLLLVQVENLSKKRVWTFPKGHPESKETDSEAAVREVREETGWQCEVIEPIMDVRYIYVHDGTRYHKTVRWFLMKPIAKTGEFDPNEILQSQWYGLEETADLITYDTDKKLLKSIEGLTPGR